MTEEIWKPVVGYEGFYEVSSLGRVRAFERSVTTAIGTTRTYQERIMKPSVSSKGYSRLTLHKEGVKKYVSLYRVVAEAFHGSPSQGKPWALHRDGDPSNNKADNIYWGSPSENARDTVRHGRNRKANKSACINGHEYIPESIYWRPDGKGRDCRICRSKASKRAAERCVPLVSGSEKHGTLTGYTTHKCRCDRCKGAYRDYTKKRLTGKPPPHVPHGTLNAYTGYGCRCEKCRGAMRNYDQERKEAKRGKSETKSGE